ncbi:hypothetical protein SDD30_14240 [Moorella naiadis]|uniref:hypothetical protein n=1 Tax=Moorella naiadis (nom. illeg.) TaxID=3093670 RepID=UPI003D9CA0A8
MAETLYYGLFVLSVAAGVFAVLLPVLKEVTGQGYRKRIDLEALKAGVGFWGKRLARNARAKGDDEFKYVVAGMAAGGMAGAMLAWGTAYLITVAAICSVLGMAAVLFLARSMKETGRMIKVRELVALYEALNFYTNAGYTIQQAMRLGAVVTPHLRPAVERCLAAWPYGPVRALERFADEVNLPEAVMLSTILMHAEEAGMQFGKVAIEEEASNLEKLRQTLAEVRIMSKPLYFAVYRGLPLFAAGGVIAGPLVYRLVSMMNMLIQIGQ